MVSTRPLHCVISHTKIFTIALAFSASHTPRHIQLSLLLHWYPTLRQVHRHKGGSPVPTSPSVIVQDPGVRFLQVVVYSGQSLLNTRHLRAPGTDDHSSFQFPARGPPIIHNVVARLPLQILRILLPFLLLLLLLQSLSLQLLSTNIMMSIAPAIITITTTTIAFGLPLFLS